MRCLIVFLVSFVCVFFGNADGAEAVLRSSERSVTGGGNSFVSAMSPNGRYVAFLSHANNLTTNDSSNPWLDVFFRDLSNKTTTLVSVDKSGRGGGDGNSSMASISGDGRWVAFASDAENLIEGDTNRITDVFLRDLSSGETRLVSATPDGSQLYKDSDNPQLSVDGRYLIFESRSEDIVSSNSGLFGNVFRYDVLEGHNQLVSVPWDGSDSPLTNAGPAHSATVSANGNWVAYVQTATNGLPETPAVSLSEVFLRDVGGSESTWVSAGVASQFSLSAAYACINPVISGDGGTVVFKAFDGRAEATLFRRTRISGLTSTAKPIAVNAVTQGWAQVSYDGRFVAYEATDGVRVWDAVADSNRLVMANLSGESARWCSQPSISSNGNVTVFMVSSNGFSALYRHDYGHEMTSLAVAGPMGGPASVMDSDFPIISSNGDLIAFDSRDDSMVGGDLNRACDVLVSPARDADAELVSLCVNQLASTTPAISSSALPPSLNVNGRFVAISTGGSDTNGFLDLSLRDRESGAVDRLSAAGYHTTQAKFSADGNYVAYLQVPFGETANSFGSDSAVVLRKNRITGQVVTFHSNAHWSRSYSTLALSPDGNRLAFVDRNSLPTRNGRPNIYLADASLGTVSLVTTPGNPLIPDIAGVGTSRDPRFTPDGRWLLFVSDAPNLTTNTLAGTGLFVRDLANEYTLYLATLQFPSVRRSVSISADSRFVVCVDTAVRPEPRAVVFNLQAGSSKRVTDSMESRSVSISSNGRWVAFDGKPTSGQQCFGIYVRDILAQLTEFVSVPLVNTNILTGNSSHPQISHDGRYVVFASDATNLVSGDANGFKDIFIRDRWRNVTMLASINRSGTGSGNGVSLLPVLAADGRTLLFQSFASDLIEGDFNETADVFVLRLGGTDTDGDGLDDDWEVAYFGNLDRDGKGDFDGDGTTDEDEHRLGTDPTNAGSVFQVMKLTREDGAGTKLLWNANPGRAYRVEFKDDLSSTDWSVAPETVTAAGATATWTEGSEAPTPHRFYRVVLAQ